jgi:capsular exopolysaccharide synthesis family protein
MNADDRRPPVTLADAHALDRFVTQRGTEPIDAVYTEVRPRQLRDSLRVFSKHRSLAVAVFLGVLALTILVTWLTQRQYNAGVRLQVARSSPIQLQLKDNVLNLDETERILNGASSFVSTQVQALKSRDLAERVIHLYGLDTNPAFLEPARGPYDLTAVAAKLPDALRPRNFEPAPPADAHTDTAPEPLSESRLLDRYLGYLDVQDVRGTDLIDVRFTTPNAALSAVLAAAHVGAFLEANQEIQLATDSQAVSFLAQQLEQSRGHLAQTETALSQFSSQHPNVAVNQEHELIGKQIGELSTLLTTAEGERVAAQTRYEFLKQRKNQPLDHLFKDSEAIQKLRLALLDIEGQIAALKQRLGPNHSQMTELRRQEAEIRLQLRQEVDSEVAAARAQYNTARMHEDELRRKLTKLEASAIELRNLGGQYELLKGDVESARTLHVSLLRQQADTAVHSELDASKVRIVERPEVPRKPSQPRLIVNLIVGLLVGVLVAVLAVFVRESLDSSVKSSDDLEGLLQLPTLALVPDFAPARPVAARLIDTLRHGEGVAGALATLRQDDRIAGVLATLRQGDVAGVLAALRRGHPVRTNGRVPPGGERRDLVVVQEPASPVAETFRMLRTALLFSSPAAPPQVILVTSAAAGEGKTVTALNLASTLADAGRRVLLIDVDLRHPGCHEVLGARLSPGLSSYLAGGVDLDEVVREVASPRIAFLSAGPPPAHPAELIGSDRMREALALVREHFDFVILDSPPVLPVTDAVLLARLADAVVLVMNGRKSPREFVRRARDQLLHVGGNVIGVVVNNAGHEWGSDYLYQYQRYRRPPMGAAEAPTA